MLLDECVFCTIYEGEKDLLTHDKFHGNHVVVIKSLDYGRTSGLKVNCRTSYGDNFNE